MAEDKKVVTEEPVQPDVNPQSYPGYSNHCDHERPVMGDRMYHMHVHDHSGLTTCDDGHAHMHPGVTSPPIRKGRSHIHMIAGYTTYHDGHFHEYSGYTGPAIHLRNAGHTHMVDLDTNRVENHRHEIHGYVQVVVMEHEDMMEQEEMD